MVDEFSLKVDRIALTNNHGVSGRGQRFNTSEKSFFSYKTHLLTQYTVIDDKLAIVQLHQQEVRIVRLTPGGNFQLITTVGYTLQPSDIFTLENHPQYRDTPRYTLPALTSFKQSLLGFFYR